MGMDLTGFDAEEIEPYDNSALPPAWYKAIITESGMEDTQTEGNQKLSLKCQVVEGDHEGRIIFANLNLINANEQAAQIAQRELSSVCRAVGVMKPNDSEELHNIEMMIKVGTRKDNAEKTEIKNWKSLADYAAMDNKPAAKATTASAAKKPAFASKPAATAAAKTTAAPASKPGPKWANKASA